MKGIVLKPALRALGNEVQKPPKGFPRYLGMYRGAASVKEAQERYVEICEQEATRFIESSFLSELGGRVRENVIEKVREIARCYAEGVDREYGPQGKTMPGRYWKEYARNIKWAVERVILRREWREIAAESKTARERQSIVEGRIQQAVRQMLPKLSLPLEAAFFGIPGRKKIGISGG